MDVWSISGQRTVRAPILNEDAQIVGEQEVTYNLYREAEKPEEPKRYLFCFYHKIDGNMHSFLSYHISMEEAEEYFKEHSAPHIEYVRIEERKSGATSASGRFYPYEEPEPEQERKRWVMPPRLGFVHIDR